LDFPLIGHSLAPRDRPLRGAEPPGNPVLRRLTFHTAGESHGRGLLTLMEGVPAGLDLDADRDIGPDLFRRQQGYGRGRRMQIESDRVEFLSGVRLGETLGSPLSMVIWNRDWENWTTAMSPLPPTEGENPGALRSLYLPRPGHADLAGVLKYDRRDTRDILERASARETAARVAAGAVARRFLSTFGIEVGSHVRSIGGIEARDPDVWPEALNAASDPSPVRVLDPESEGLMVAAIEAAKEAGDTLGGVFEVVVTGLPVGLGSHVSWDRRLDARLGAAILSIQAVKGVEIGLGFEAAARPGSRVHDAIHASDTPESRRAGGFERPTNGAGGLEGGITTGAPLVVRGAMKPISTLMKNRLPSVDLRTGAPAVAATERSDVCAVPAAGVVGEAMVALVLADAFLEKFGGDSMSEIRRNFEGTLAYLSDRGWGGRSLP
jgi:chorismate synthase